MKSSSRRSSTPIVIPPPLQVMPPWVRSSHSRWRGPKSLLQQQARWRRVRRVTRRESSQPVAATPGLELLPAWGVSTLPNLDRNDLHATSLTE